MPESAAELENLTKINLVSRLTDWVKNFMSLFNKQKFDSRWLQEDFDLAYDAAQDLETAIADPQSRISASIYQDQESLFAFLEASERQLRKKRLDGLCKEKGVLDMAGFEAVAKAEALKIIGNRPTAALGGFIILVADLDGLGRVNDTLGHPAGNEFIVGAADKIKSSIRATDIVGRFGGDEFIVLLPFDKPEAAQVLMEIGRTNKDDGSRTPGIIQLIKTEASELKVALKSEYGDHFPADDPAREKGKFPGQISVGWHYLSASQFAQRYSDCESPTAARKSFTECLIVEADKKMYDSRRSGPIPALPPGVPPETVSS